MQEATSDFINQVQQQLQEKGASAELNIDEQDIVDDFADKQFSALQCAERIIDSRAY
jgi:hypothetical protein